MLAPFYTERYGMKKCLIVFSALQAVICGAMMATRNKNLFIVLAAICGITGGRLAFSYILLADQIPTTHIAVFSMWFSGT